MEAYSCAFISSPVALDLVRGSLEVTMRMYELLTQEGVGMMVLDMLSVILEEIPKSYNFIVKAAKRSAMVKARVVYAELLDLFKSDEVDIKIRVMVFINNLLKFAPNDKLVCRFMAQLESLNFYEYLQEATKLQCDELNQAISNFQILGKVVIRTTQYENEALRNRIKELQTNCTKLEEKLMLFAEQQNLFDYLKDDFRCLEALAKMSVERGTLYTPCTLLSSSLVISLNQNEPEKLKSLPLLVK
eukprot:TRINITY_DN3687_c0_g1_i11.p1 TRINITY_DN3687_c0_g1~~TRINITY_DN3687_c0_g1_i11.p1  ORF type:complete len:245 (+),score=73.08 TRINITY_DN3687_c0_g1_i11:681-1415(+)